MRKKQKRIRRDAATKAAVVARAQVVGAAQAAQELLGNAVLGSMVNQWARRTGVELPKFIYIPKTGERRRMSGPEDPPGLGSGNPEPRQVTVTPPSEGGDNNIVADTPRNRAIAERVVRGESRARVGAEVGVTASRVSQIAMALGPAIAKELGIDWAPRSYPTRRKRDESGTLVSSRRGEQLAMYEPPTTPQPQRVTAHPVDEAEAARSQAQNQMLETALRQALRERDAFKLVHEVTMREKNER